ncbi:MAG: mannitol-1-phosphate 5-dehydrogenase [Treponema sp. GWB1_62_6]|nr:MAG: mannitol-1-phosphate 5-dehydrogenase [Treponema sp. GWC1_61_84]OHE63182.1 MAG: mannitol-1-phosphate 5-dehydrogenase [Treponema sp. GWB1_62_6]
MKIVQFGAGNIGRSFIGQLFSRALWEVVFVDVNAAVVALLNEKRSYTVIVKREGRADERRIVGPVRAVDGRDADAVAAEIADADLVSTSVGKAALPKILPVIARGLAGREKRTPGRPLDIVIAENARGADELFRSTLASELGPSYPLSALVGLVETSIGKMVPLMRAEDLADDPLQVFAEEFETLIMDGKAFRGPVPGVPGLHPVDDIRAYVDRKLFVHNLGHAAVAYLGYRADPSVVLLADALRLPRVAGGARAAMDEAADALAAEYPAAYSRAELAAHIEDLLFRFSNRALGDTVHRVGRDLYRKLDREDRLAGALLLLARRGLPSRAVAEVYRAALEFAAPDENGRLFPDDERFRRDELPKGTEAILRGVSMLDPAESADARAISAVLG